MDSRQALNRLLESGKSPELVAAFRNIAEATGPDGQDRYSQRVCRELVRIIVCRTYTKPVLQLCHLVNAAQACGSGADRYERFFFAGHPATATGFRGYVETALATHPWRRPGFNRATNGIAIDYGDAAFTIAYSRMPSRAALLEFLMATGSYRPGNVIDLRDATLARLIEVFGNERTHKGKLYSWVRAKE